MPAVPQGEGALVTRHSAGAGVTELIDSLLEESSTGTSAWKRLNERAHGRRGGTNVKVMARHDGEMRKVPSAKRLQRAKWFAQFWSRLWKVPISTPVPRCRRGESIETSSVSRTPIRRPYAEIGGIPDVRVVIWAEK